VKYRKSEIMRRAYKIPDLAPVDSLNLLPLFAPRNELTGPLK